MPGSESSSTDTDAIDETEKTKLLQIILVGQPELLDKLKLDSLRQLNQRIAVRYHILPLRKEELQKYIEHRIHIAQKELNGHPSVQFSDDAIEAIFHFSRGTPRLINILCDRALLNGFVREIRSIDQTMICKCAKEAINV